MTTAAQIQALGCGSYLEVKQLEDGTFAVRAQLAFTRSIMLGVTEVQAFETRYCYDDYLLCQNEFDKLRVKADVPAGWIAKRPQ